MNARAAIDILIPTRNRPCALAVTLASLSAQTFRDFRVVISDQSDDAASFSKPEAQAVMRQMRATGIDVLALRHLPRRGMAEQRAFLLAQATARHCLYLDDDVLLENDMVERMHHAITMQQCGFVGSALHGMSFLDDIRPHQQHIEFWDGKVEPERVAPGSPAWTRHHLHSAANLFHVQAKLGLTRATTRLYRVAWIGGCVLFDTEKLRSAGGFDFWEQLPEAHCGEDVLAQLRVMERYGGCGMIPSGAYHLELPTTIATRDIDAPKVLPLSITP
ncbi:glycosyltransferase family A protein [Noviherbaspirillum denitrificans]|uniref:Glycosyl transferase n=1 Tax=Noviherbaspirillum denitrificans TaxID=1968433 RepID=A0A254TFJ1_9BURK|nr:glycosyltransferase family A protein [Noviherbaspirillum denitrificans]OWW21401.1 glycosyl transferase [Noviherbaspirillum denitrificans]